MMKENPNFMKFYFNQDYINRTGINKKIEFVDNNDKIIKIEYYSNDNLVHDDSKDIINDENKYQMILVSFCDDLIKNSFNARSNNTGILYTSYTLLNHHRHLLQLYHKAEAKGKPLDVAIIIGADPITWLEGGMPDRLVPLELDELEVANALMHGGLEVVKGETVDLEIPASSEIVIEGKMAPGLREPEGPFGDYSRVYDGPPRENPIIEVTAATHRKNPIYLDCLPGSIDNFLLGSIPREADLFDHVNRAVPNVNYVHLTMGGCGRFHAVVQMDKKFETDPYSAITAMYSPAEASRDLKLVTVVDGDIDPFDSKDVEWAVATRTQWDLDLVMIPKMATALDPSAIRRTPPHMRARSDHYTTKVGLDATVSFEKPEYMESFQKTRIPATDE